MIFDTLENMNLYSRIGERLEKAVNYALTTNFSQLQPGKYEVLGKEIFAIVNEYRTKKIDDVPWEAHQKYADIQIMVRGCETIGFCMADSLKATTEYDEAKDIYFLSGQGNYVNVSEGEFALFFPHDAHRPGIATNECIDIKKVVIKVLV